MIAEVESHIAVVERRRRLLHLCNGRSVTVLCRRI